MRFENEGFGILSDPIQFINRVAYEAGKPLTDCRLKINRNEGFNLYKVRDYCYGTIFIVSHSTYLSLLCEI